MFERVGQATLLAIHVQTSAKGLVNFIPAVAYHFCLSLPAAFMQPGASTSADLRTAYSQAQRQMCILSYVLGLFGVAMNQQQQYSTKVLFVTLTLRNLVKGCMNTSQR